STSRAPWPTATRGSRGSTRPASRGVVLGLRSLRMVLEIDAGQRAFTLDDPAGTRDAVLTHDVVELARLVDALGDVRRDGQRHLAVAQQPPCEPGLRDRRHDALRLRYQLGLAQPAGRLRRLDEPLRVLRAHVVVDPPRDGLCAELRDGVARIDALRAALVAEVAAGAVPDPVL